MYNDFVLVGPDTDPAQIKGEKDASAALMQIMAQGAVFISRGDNSGTHMAERRLWSEVGQDPSEFEEVGTEKSDQVWGNTKHGRSG